jgi:hypothetical protein
MRTLASHNNRVFLRGRYLRVAAAVVLFATLTACKTSQDAVIAANQLSTASQQLTAYYADLQQQMSDTVALSQLQSDLLGVPFEDTDRAQLDTTRQELAKRAAMAKAMGALATAYAGLAGSKAGAEIGTAASELANQLVGMKALPGGPAIPDIVGQAGQMLVEAIRARKLKQSSAKIAEAVNAVNHLFDKESPVYESINRQRVILAESLAIVMMQKDMVEVNLSFPAALKPFDLVAKLPAGGATPEVRHLAEAEIKIKGDSQISGYNDATKALSASLAIAAKQVDSVAKKH